MRKGSDLIGKVIVAYDTGRKIARVKDLMFDQDSNQLVALLVEEAGLFSGARVLPFQNIKAVGQDAIITITESAIVPASKFAEANAILKGDNVIRGTQILTTDGRNLGRMVDLYFDEFTGTVEGYEASGGLFADAYSGRSFVPALQTLNIGEDVSFVPAEVADMMEEQVGGLRGAMQSASGKVQAAAQITGDKLQAATTEAGQRLQEVGRKTTAAVTNAVVDPQEQKAFVIGNAAESDVIDASGTELIIRGQLITAADADLVEAQGLLDHLYRAAGGSVNHRATEKLQGAVGTAGEKLQSARRSATAAVTNRVVDPATQKAFVLSKLPEWTVTSASGELIGLSGQPVTPAVAELAESAGVLDELYRATGGRITEELTRRADGLAASQVVEQAQGRRVLQTVRTAEGLIVAAPGQIVTERVIEQAKRYHQEQSLLQAVGLTPQAVLQSTLRYRANGMASSTGDQLGSTAQSVSEQVSRGADQVKTEAQTLWQQLRETASDLQARSNRVVEEQRIKNALGRPVTRVILDHHDQVILNLGDLITHQAIEQARQANLLDVLLTSVYSQTPDFSKSELRAPEVGMAALKGSH